MKEVRDILGKARALIERPENWTRGVNARAADNSAIEYESPRACKFCLYGALMKVTTTGDDMQFYAQCVNALRRICPDRAIFTFNDDPSTTHADILSLIDRAIEGEQQREHAT